MSIETTKITTQTSVTTESSDNSTAPTSGGADIMIFGIGFPLVAMIIAIVFGSIHMESRNSEAKAGFDHVISLSQEHMSSLSVEELVEQRKEIANASPGNTGYPKSVIDREWTEINELIEAKTAR